jgi:hypothetical protein
MSFIGSGILLFLLVKGKNYLKFDRNFDFSFSEILNRSQVSGIGYWVLGVGFKVGVSDAGCDQ